MAYTACKSCGREMAPGGTCDPFSYCVNGNKRVDPVPYEAWETVNCHDCNVAPGNYHHPGCDWERCANCGGQLIGCDCLGTEEEREEEC